MNVSTCPEFPSSVNTACSQPPGVEQQEVMMGAAPILCCTALYCTALYCIIQYCTVLYRVGEDQQEVMMGAAPILCCTALYYKLYTVPGMGEDQQEVMIARPPASSGGQGTILTVFTPPAPAGCCLCQQEYSKILSILLWKWAYILFSCVSYL